MCVQYATSVFAGRVYRAVNREAGRIDVIGRIENDVPVDVDFDETARRHLFEHQPVSIDEKMIIRTGNSRRDMREYQVIPPKHGDKPVAGGEVVWDQGE